MSLTPFPHGISSMGLPIVGGRYITTGDIHFVDNATGSNATDRGGDTDHAFADFDYSIGQCTANKGDFTFLMPNHAETITGAGGLTFDVAGASFIGLGRYDQRPAILVDGAAASCLVTGADVWIKNMVFSSGHADLAYCFFVTGVGCRLDSLVIDESTTNENWIDAIHAGTTDNDFDGLEIINCEIIMDDASSVTAIDILKESKDVKIIGNRITGDFDASPIAPIYIATAETPLNILIAHNLIHNQHDGDAALCISVTATAATGWMIYNHAGHKLNTGDTAFLGGADGLYMGENYAADRGGVKSGFLYPLADS